jgi:demethylmenaquinone methyltransferase/2-methoxy-6-polyprenyl-1,4-benzoquinol methylase
MTLRLNGAGNEPSKIRRDHADVPSKLLSKNPTTIREMFAEVAPRYDLLNHVLSLGSDLRWRRKLARWSPRPLTGPVLDVCCGTGDLAFAYWRAARRQIQVVGLDFCLPMLRLAQRKTIRHRAGQWLQWVLGDAQALPFPEDRFQVVSVAFGIRNVADPLQTLREMIRVCRPAGQVAVLEFSLPGHPLLRRVYLWYFHGILPFLGNLVSRNRYNAYGYLPASVQRFDQGEQFLEKMKEAGLVALTLKPLSGGIATAYFGYKPAS